MPRKAGISNGHPDATLQSNDAGPPAPSSYDGCRACSWDIKLTFLPSLLTACARTCSPTLTHLATRAAQLLPSILFPSSSTSLSSLRSPTGLQPLAAHTLGIGLTTVKAFISTYSRSRASRHINSTSPPQHLQRWSSNPSACRGTPRPVWSVRLFPLFPPLPPASPFAPSPRWVSRLPPLHFPTYRPNHIIAAQAAHTGGEKGRKGADGQAESGPCRREAVQAHQLTSSPHQAGAPIPQECSLHRPHLARGGWSRRVYRYVIEQLMSAR